MVRSLFEKDIQDIIAAAKNNTLDNKTKKVRVGNKDVSIPVPFKSPMDWRDHVIYFLMIDRFNCPDDTGSPLPFEEKTNTCLGGKIKGITQKLDYIKDLGASAIWLSPFNKNTRDSIHGYSIQDFLSVDPRFGTEDGLIELVDQAHARGMYIIFDIVLNHAGDVFAYKDHGSAAPHREDHEDQYSIFWRKGDYTPKPEWMVAPGDIVPGDPDLTPDAAIFPDEIRNNEYFRRRGKSAASDQDKTKEQRGDFETLKEFITEYLEERNARSYYPVRDLLIKIYQYIIANYDVDGFRIDTIKHVERDCALVFGNAIREFAYVIGKQNFLTFGEAKTGDEKTLAAYTGRFASDTNDLYGLDSTLDFPLMWKMQSVGKGFEAPLGLAKLYDYRKRLLKGEDNDGKVLVSSHGEAGRFYVTKFDNHDEPKRFRHCPKPNDINAPFDYDNQVFLAFGCLCGLIGIPCIYYGTEQGLRGDSNGDNDGPDWYVREALWGKPKGGFDQDNFFYKEFKRILHLRSTIPAMRYGRQYFRPLSGNERDFGISPFKGGIIAFSRILHDTEILFIANTNTDLEQHISVIVDYDLNPDGKQHTLLYSNYGASAQNPDTVRHFNKDTVSIRDVDDGMSTGPIKCLKAHLKKMELQIVI